MNAHEQLARMDEYLRTHPAPRSIPDAASYLDEDTLRRSRHTLTAGPVVRRRMDQPTEPWQDEIAVVTGERRAS